MGHITPEKQVFWGVLNIILPVGRSSSKLTTSESQNSTLGFATSSERNQDEFDDGFF